MGSELAIFKASFQKIIFQRIFTVVPFFNSIFWNSNFAKTYIYVYIYIYLCVLYRLSCKLLQLNPGAWGEHLTNQLSWVAAWLLVTCFVCPIYLVHEESRRSMVSLIRRMMVLLVYFLDMVWFQIYGGVGATSGNGYEIQGQNHVARLQGTVLWIWYRYSNFRIAYDLLGVSCVTSLFGLMNSKTDSRYGDPWSFPGAVDFSNFDTWTLCDADCFG